MSGVSEGAAERPSGALMRAWLSRNLARWPQNRWVLDAARPRGNDHRMAIRTQCLCIDTADRPARIAAFVGWCRTVEQDAQVSLVPPEGSLRTATLPNLPFFEVPVLADNIETLQAEPWPLTRTRRRF